MRNVCAIATFVVLSSLTVVGWAQDVGTADMGAAASVSEVQTSAQRIGLIFAEIDGIRDVQITVRNDVVTLEGEVSSAKLRDDAEAIAAKVEGVVYVQNRLSITEDLTQEPAEKTTGDEVTQSQLNAIFAVVPSLTDVTARVEAGVVHLEGETLAPEATEKAEELARSMPGVVFVDNQILESVAVSDRLSPAWLKAQDVGRELVQRLPLFGLGVIVLILFWIIARFISRRLPLSRLKETPLAQDFVRQLIHWVIVIVGLFVALEVWGVTSLVAAVMGTAGIAGIGIGFAFKDIVENYLAGILLGMKQPFRKNDFVDIDGFQGKVLRLTSRETVLMTLDGNHLSLPNSLVFKGVLYNYSKNPLRRFDFVVGVNPNEDFKEVLNLGLETLRKTKGVTTKPRPSITLDEFGDWTINVHMWAWVDQREHGLFAVKSEAIRRINEAFQAADIDMPEPMQRVSNLEGLLRNRKKIEVSEDTVVDLSPEDPVDSQMDVDRGEHDESDYLED